MPKCTPPRKQTLNTHMQHTYNTFTFTSPTCEGNVNMHCDHVCGWQTQCLHAHACLPGVIYALYMQVRLGHHKRADGSHSQPRSRARVHSPSTSDTRASSVMFTLKPGCPMRVCVCTGNLMTVVRSVSTNFFLGVLDRWVYVCAYTSRICVSVLPKRCLCDGCLWWGFGRLPPPHRMAC